MRGPTLKQLSGSSLCFHACELWTVHVLSVCLHTLQCAPAARDVKQLLFGALGLRGVITLFSSCENTSKQNHYV